MPTQSGGHATQFALSLYSPSPRLCGAREKNGLALSELFMPAFWFGVVSVMLAVYVVLDGFDFGAGTIHRLVAKTDDERRTVLAAIGPYWDGNEVWLIAGGGVLFFAFPRA